MFVFRILRTYENKSRISLSRTAGPFLGRTCFNLFLCCCCFFLVCCSCSSRLFAAAATKFCGRRETHWQPANGICGVWYLAWMWKFGLDFFFCSTSGCQPVVFVGSRIPNRPKTNVCLYSNCIKMGDGQLAEHFTSQGGVGEIILVFVFLAPLHRATAKRRPRTTTKKAREKATRTGRTVCGWQDATPHR